MNPRHRAPRATTLLLVAAIGLASSYAAADWSVLLPADLQADEAITVALDDLVQTGAVLQHPIRIQGDAESPQINTIFLGGPSQNLQTNHLLQGSSPLPSPPENPEGFRITPLARAPYNHLVLTANGPLGYAYGLYWIRDRMLVNKQIPESLEALREPAFPIRLGGAWGRWGFGGQDKDQMRLALRNSINWVAGAPILDLVPWDVEPEATENAKNREETRTLIEYAHAMHIKYFAFANEFTYHPALLEKHGATLSPDDPRFWEALQDKFRMLFTALPELDGIELCNDDISGFWDNYRPYDLLHENPASDWSYSKRFRTFVQKVHEVVANEFDKEYFHFTWSLSDHEQHTQAAVYREIFTEEIPTNNFYAMPKITRADRWWHQAYNPTFNQTPHETIVLFETMNYYEGGKTPIFPTFSGDYFQRGLQTFLLPENTNVRGISMLASIPGDTWGTRDAYAYVLYRLMWNPYEDMNEIARDFCAIHFGPQVATEMAEIYQLSAHAYKYGLHIEPISYGQYNSFYHMRVGVFPVEGYPSIDHGREHLEWLRKIYLRIKPWEVETLQDIRHGHEVAGEMHRKFQTVRERFEDQSLAANLENRLEMTRHLIDTNLHYVECMLAYFDFMDRPLGANREKASRALQETRATMAEFEAGPGFGYQLWGIEALTSAMASALEDLEAHRLALQAAPTRKALERTIAEQQQRFAAVQSDDTKEKVKFAHVRVLIDGRDILNIQGETYRIEHIRWDPPHVQEFTFHAPLPRRQVTVIPVDIESRPLHPFILEQPNSDNDFTARLYLDDLPGGQGWMEFDLYYIDEEPSALGLSIPWTLKDQRN